MVGYNMIKKDIKYYKRGRSFTSSISISKKDLKNLNVQFKENDNKKSKDSIEEYYILTNKEYNQLNIHNNKLISDNKELEQLKGINEQLNKEIDVLTNKYNHTIKELEKEKETINNINKIISDLEEKYQNNIIQLNEKNQKNIIQLQEKQIKEIKNHSNEKIKYENLLNIYKFIVINYEKQIKDFNNRNIFSRIFNHTLKLQDKESLKDNESIEYIPKKQ